MVRRSTINYLSLFIAAILVGYQTVVIGLYLKRNLKSSQSSNRYLIKPKYYFQGKSNEFYEKFIRWNRTLCSQTSDRRGPHQKVIAISIYAKGSKVVDNPMYSWENSVFIFLEPLIEEIKLLLPQWILRIYIDFTGSTKSQQEYFKNFSNVDICDINHIPMFDSSLTSLLSGRMWRFIPIFDPYVDYLLSRDLDSPILQRETETIDLWLSRDHKKNFFYIARDHTEHGVVILAGLWGAALKMLGRNYLIFSNQCFYHR